MCYFRELLERELKICLAQLETNTDESQELILPDVIQGQFQNSLRSVCYFKQKLCFESTFYNSINSVYLSNLLNALFL